MRKLLYIFICLVPLVPLSATPLFLFTGDIEYGYDTNVFSSPLPQYEEPDAEGNLHWFPWRAENPFLKMHSVGISFTFDIYPDNGARTGFSSYIGLKVPFKATSITPVAKEPGNFTWKWEYVEADSTKEQTVALFAGIGPVFKTDLGLFDLGIALRLSFGAYDLTAHELIMGLQAEPFWNLKFTDSFYLNVKMTYDIHMMKFWTNSTTEIYDEHYHMLSVAPSIGIGFRF